MLLGDRGASVWMSCVWHCYMSVPNCPMSEWPTCLCDLVHFINIDSNRSYLRSATPKTANHSVDSNSSWLLCIYHHGPLIWSSHLLSPLRTDLFRILSTSENIFVQTGISFLTFQTLLYVAVFITVKAMTDNWCNRQINIGRFFGNIRANFYCWICRR